MKRKFAALRCAAAAPTGLLADVQRLPCVASGLQAKRLAAISVKGDWPFLISAGNLVRNFRRAPKQGHTSGGAGICHLCLAGQQNYPFSDCGENPRWARTEGSAAAAIAWDTVMPFTALLPGPAGSPERLGHLAQLAFGAWPVLFVFCYGCGEHIVAWHFRPRALCWNDSFMACLLPT